MSYMSVKGGKRAMQYTRFASETAADVERAVRVEVQMCLKGRF